MSNDKLAEALRNARSFVSLFHDDPAQACLDEIDAALQTHADEAAQAQAAQDAKLPSDEDFRLHLGELTPTELRVARAAFRYAMAKESGR